MSGKRPVSFANFICRFGDQEMLDLSEEIVVPAFLGALKRTYKETTYFLHEVEIHNLSPRSDDVEPAICGRLVKDTVLRSHQVFKDGLLVKSSANIEAAPTAFFVLLLRSHKLIYLSEFQGAPSLETFRSTVLQFIKKQRAHFINEAFKSATAAPSMIKRVTKKNLADRFPEPTLEILPLTNDETILDAIKQFHLLQMVSVRLVKPNHEVNPNKFFEDAQNTANGLDAATASLTFRSQQKGLSKLQARKTVEGALHGNAEVTLSGVSENGARLSLTNDDIKVVALIEPIVQSVKATAGRLLKIFQDYRNSGTLKVVPEVQDQSITPKLQRIVDKSGANEST